MRFLIPVVTAFALFLGAGMVEPVFGQGAAKQRKHRKGKKKRGKRTGKKPAAPAVRPVG